MIKTTKVLALFHSKDIEGKKGTRSSLSEFCEGLLNNALGIFFTKSLKKKEEAYFYMKKILIHVFQPGVCCVDISLTYTFLTRLIVNFMVNKVKFLKPSVQCGFE